MYIKQVIIEGFKSYKEQVAIEPFSPKHNCIVGANGSGKTNFFNAIRFVLSDFTTQLRAEDRQRLLHDGAGQSVLSAYVEIVFDNTDNRLPIDKEVVRLRRSIGLKKDEYFLDRKHMTKPEVMNLLESAGFSRSNPYYVVQQGKIQALTVMRDTERLELLKEIGGTKVYDERRKESLKILQETAARQTQIEETIAYIDERLAELNEEREELVKYQEIDRKRRSLEYTIFEKELSDTRAKLDEVDAARQRANDKANKVHEEARGAHAEVQNLVQEGREMELRLAGLSKEQRHLEAERAECTQRKAQLELDCQDAEERLQSDQAALVDKQQELQSIEADLQQSHAELARIRPTYEEKLRKEEAVTSRIVECEDRLAALYKKQGRGSQYKCQAEKDAAVQREIREKKKELDRKLEQMKKLAADAQSIEHILVTGQERSAELQKIMDESKQELQAAEKEHAELQALRNTLANQRHQHWKAEDEKESDLQKMQQDMKKKEKFLEASLPRDLQNGLNSVKRICNDHRISGVHGPLIELFECQDKFDTAVEVTAGTSLFHIVVDTDEIGSKIIHYLNQEKGGRVSVLPLNVLEGKAASDTQSNDAIPLISRLSYQEKYHPAFVQLFGKVLLCRSLDVATAMSRQTNLDCITMEGDQVNKKGAVTGGYHDLKHSRMASMRAIKTLSAKMTGAKQELDAAKASHAQVEAEINQALTKLEKARVRQQKVSSVVEAAKSELAELVHGSQTRSNQLEAKQRQLRATEDAITRVRAQIQEAEEELKVDLTACLTSDEKAELASLNPEIQRLKKEQVKASTERMDVETRKSKMEVSLETNLVKRKSELESEIEGVNLADRSQTLQAHKIQLQGLTQQLSELTLRFQEKKSQISECKLKATSVKARLDELKTLQDAEEQLLQEEAKEMEQLMSKRTTLLQKREELQRQIRELGSLPSNAFDKYKGKAVKDLHRALQQCHEAIKKFSHVNKKALDQFLQFTEQREDLSRRHEEVETSKTKIAELVEGLDRKKDEDIERTFRGVAMHFKEIFNEIVQTGKGELVMIKNKDAEGEENTNLEAAVEKYSAVQCRVSFGGGEAKTMKQLSGGQKAVVALSLIFAIQKVDPAPFYLFDEIDAALDAQYRAAVGNMIKKQANSAGTQFVTTTFRPELVKVCAKVYGVTHKNRVSCVDVITKEDALGFIEDFN